MARAPECSDAALADNFFDWITMTPQLRTKIDELIVLDNQRRNDDAKKYPDGIMIDLGSPKSLAILDDILHGEKSPVITALEKLSRDELVYVTALMWFGRGDGIAEPGATFDFVLDYAKSQFSERSVVYVGEKPLGDYLPRGLKRLGIN